MPDYPDTVYFESCADIVEFFRDGRQYFNPEILEKLSRTSLYWNRFQTKPWPVNTAPEQTAFRLPRGGFDETSGWQTIDASCGADTCAAKMEIVEMPGSESYNFQLLEKAFTTRQFCIKKWKFKLFPTAQLAHMMQNLAIISDRINQEFARANVIGLSGNHWLPMSTTDNVYCGEFEDQGWVVEQFEGDGEGGYNLKFIRVKCDPANLDNIALLGLDVMDDVLQRLSEESDAYRLDVLAITGGVQLLDIVVPDAKTARNLMLQAKNDAGHWYSNSGWDKDLRELGLGIRQTVGNYMLSYDSIAPRFNADSAFNSTLAAYNENDPDTWPRLIRVPDQIRVAADGEGCKYIPNPAFRVADFAISMPWTPDPVTMWTSANTTSTAIAPGKPDFTLDWEMIRPPFSDCNRFDEEVLWQARVNRAAQVDDTQILNPILHRLDNRRQARGACCPINSAYVDPTGADCYNCADNQEVQS